MNLLLINSIDFPFGGAQSMMVSLFIKGLRKNSATAFLIIPYGRKKEYLESTNNNYGHYDGVPYLIIKQSRNSRKIYTFFDKCISIFYTTYLIYKRNRKKKVDAVILGGIPDILRDSPLIILCLLLRIPLYPWFVEKMSLSKDYYGLPGMLNRQSQKLTEKILASLSAGVIVISTLLKKHYLKYLPENKILISPILVATDISKPKETYCADRDSYINNNTKVLVYSGSFAEKDGIYCLINAFNKLHKRYPESIFVMTGQSPDEVIMNRVKIHIKNLHLEDRVKLVGFVSSKELSYYNSIAHILFVCRSNSPFANYGFPWKLGEYCMTGKPIIATRVGDIEYYFRNNENIFVVEPDNHTAIAEKIAHIFCHYEEALLVAQKGREIALKNFNYIEKTSEVIQFIKNTRPKRKTYPPLHWDKRTVRISTD